jgi:hypothetical protein
MPRYTFVTDDGEQFEHVCSVADYVDTITLDDGRVAKRDFVTDFSSISRPAMAGWPMTCFASGVHASQAGELREFFAKRGCPTEVTKDGDPVYRSASHRKQALKLRGMHDRKAFC